MSFANRIDISGSSILSLKAELARKHEEFRQLKSGQAVSRPASRSGISSILNKTNAGVTERASRDVEDKQEENKELERSRSALESKAKLYDKLASGCNDVETDSKFLVDFSQKTSEVDSKNSANQDEDESECDEDEWVDYIDCLGRSRSCMKKDLLYLKGKDADLAQALGKKGEASTMDYAEIPVDSESHDKDNTLEITLISSDMKREQMRQKWEQDEEELRKKSDIHYQDVLFDEVRSHGVAYYAFSKEEETRKKQQEELTQRSKETETKQVAAEALKQKRCQQLDARLKAARARKRARLGLPPEEEVEVLEENFTQEVEEKVSLESLSEENSNSDLQSMKRKNHVRPWDIGKKGVRNVMSQDEWVDKKRSERQAEFAPPLFYQTESANRHTVTTKILDTFSDHVYESEKPDIPQKMSTWKQNEGPAGVCMSKINFSNKQIGRDYSVNWKPTNSSVTGEENCKIFVDDLDSDNSDDETRKKEKRRRGTEIPPPATFEYFGPSVTRAQQSSRLKTDIAESINVGISYLEKQDTERKKIKEKGLLGII